MKFNAQNTLSIMRARRRFMFTPERIESLKPNEVFVFGSNMNGNHYGGAARIAYDHFGASWGVGEGESGMTYAIPTLNHGMEKVTHQQLSGSISRFIAFCEEHPEKEFYLTKIGCGIAGWSIYEVAEIFFETLKNITKLGMLPSNLVLPKEFHLYPKIKMSENKLAVLQRRARKSSDENERERLHNAIVDEESRLNVLRDEIGYNKKS